MSKFPGMRLYNNAIEARATMLRLARDETAASIGTLIEIRDDMRLPASCRASAAIYLLDRAGGRPHTAVAVADVCAKVPLREAREVGSISDLFPCQREALRLR